MPFLTNLVKGLAGGVASAVGDPGSTTTTNQNTNTTGEQNTNHNDVSYQDFTTWLANLLHSDTYQAGSTTGSTQFNLDPATQELLKQLTSRYSSAATPFNTGSYQAGQTQQINANSDLQKQAVQATLAARGIQGPAAGTALNNVDAQRFGQINQMQAQTPFVKDQFDMNHLLQSANFFNMIPKGTSTTGTNTQQGQVDTSQNTQGNNVMNGRSSGTGYQANQGATNSSGTSTTHPTSGAGAFFGGLASTLANIL